MSGPLTERRLEWADHFRLDRRVAAAVFGLRPLRYLAEGAIAQAAIEGLHVVAVGSLEKPIFHASTGIYGFLRLPPGPRRIEITDPLRRMLPWAITANVPDRSAVRAALEQGVMVPNAPPPLLADVPLRLAPDAALAPGLTEVWGLVRDQTGAPVPLARIACVTVGGGSVVTYTRRDGAYSLILPGEKPASLVSPPQFDFERALTLHAPEPGLAKALTTSEIVTVMPADLHTVDLNAMNSPFRPRQYLLHRVPSPSGVVPPPTPNADLPVRAAARSRWDIELLP